MKRFAFIYTFILFSVSVFSQNCDKTYFGEGTFYGYGGGGNCSFPTPESPVYTGAMNELQYDTSMTCGACVEVTGNKGSLVIRIEDRCPECKYGDIDLSEEAFPLIDDIINGRVPISWKFVACPVQGAVKFYFKEGSSIWWTAVQVRNHKYPVTKLEYKVDGRWVNIPRLMYNYFVVEHPGMGAGPFDFRITDMYGDIIEENNIPFIVTTEIDGQRQFPDCNGSTYFPVTEVILSPQTLTINTKSTAQLTATVFPADADNANVIWFSSNTEVATVSDNGKVTGIAVGTATITVTTVDGGFTDTSNVTITDIEEGLPCDDPEIVSLPFTKDGAGEFCFVSSQSIASVNSWDMDLIEVNGEDFTNVWSDNLPAPINGNYYIFYKGLYDWSHFEAVNLKSVENIENVSKVFPNPFSETFILDIANPDEIQSIAILDQLGRTIRLLEKTEITSTINIGQELVSGTYILVLKTKTEVKTLFINKK